MSLMDPGNRVNALCIRGMEAEGRGDLTTARHLFRQAWEQRTTSVEAAIAAHYVARHQDTADDALRWNQRAIDEALGSDVELVAGMLPSLYLNLGKSYEDNGDLDLARRNYQLASETSHVLGVDGYGRMIRSGINAALERTGKVGGDGLK
jgi:hypothetical protein